MESKIIDIIRSSNCSNVIHSSITFLSKKKEKIRLFLTYISNSKYCISNIRDIFLICYDNGIFDLNNNEPLQRQDILNFLEKEIKEINQLNLKKILFDIYFFFVENEEIHDLFIYEVEQRIRMSRIIEDADEYFSILLENECFINYKQYEKPSDFTNGVIIKCIINNETIPELCYPHGDNQRGNLTGIIRECLNRIGKEEIHKFLLHTQERIKSFTFEKEEEGSTYFNDLDIWKIHSSRENLMNDFQKILSFHKKINVLIYSKKNNRVTIFDSKYF